VRELGAGHAANAARRDRGAWRSELRVGGAGHGEGTAGRIWQKVVIDDDGKGLDEAEITEAMKRGRRLDETKPGTGLGLSIVSEIAREYQGTLALDRGEMGGLRATLVLPAVAPAAS
jgi:signal transduction histidine kinase